MKLTKDLLSGLMFLFIGLGGALVATRYNFGTPTRMGPGFFPIAVGGIIGLFGIWITIQALLRPDDSEVVPMPQLRPIFFIALAIITFGLLIESYGLIAALVALVLIARLAGNEGSLLEVGLMVLVITAMAYVIFVYLLNIRLVMVPW